MRAEQKTPLWQYVVFYSLMLGLLAAFLIPYHYPHALLTLSAALPAILISYPGWYRELDKVLRERNSPSTTYLWIGIYFLYCSAVWWYLRQRGGWIPAYGCLMWALIFCEHGLHARLIAWLTKRKAERKDEQWHAFLAERDTSPRPWENMSEEERAERRGIHPQ